MISSDPGREPSFAIERCEELIHVDDFGLQLDDEHGPTAGMPAEEVDGPALPVHRECRLRHEHPGRPPCGERSSHRFMERRMGAIQEAIELAATPPRHQVEPHLKGARDGPKRVDGLRPEHATLHPRDGRP